MKALKVVCECGHEGQIPCPYVAFSILGFLLDHQCQAPVVTLVCNCGDMRQVGPAAPKARLNSVNDVDWINKHALCPEIAMEEKPC